MKMTGNGLTLQMEDMSMSYLMALLAKNGYSLLNWNHDTDGVDATVSCKGLPAEGCLLVSPKLDIQLKSSYSKVKVKQNGDLTYELEAKNNHTNKFPALLLFRELYLRFRLFQKERGSFYIAYEVLQTCYQRSEASVILETSLSLSSIPSVLHNQA